MTPVVGMFPGVALPRVLEVYRTVVFDQLYTRTSAFAYQSLCWASEELAYPAEAQGKVLVFPGEERYLREVRGVNFDALRPRGVHCTYRKVEYKISGEGEGTTVRDLHYCRLPPAVDVGTDDEARPLLCRMSPLVVRRTKDPREAVFMLDRRMVNTLLRAKSSVEVNQRLHDFAQVFIALWPFLSDAWWTYYEGGVSSRRKLVEVGRFKFQLNDDTVFSYIRGAPPIWKTEILTQVADAECPECEGTGIEFWDHLPVPQRRHDLCRTCVLPALGATFNGLLIDPSSKKVLNPDGTTFRGDKV